MAFHVCVISAYREFAHSSLKHQPHLEEAPIGTFLYMSPEQMEYVPLMKLLMSTALGWRSMRFAIITCSTKALHTCTTPDILRQLSFKDISSGHCCVAMWWNPASVHLNPNRCLNRKPITTAGLTISYGASLRIVGPRNHPTADAEMVSLSFAMSTVALSRSSLSLYNS